MTKRLTPSALKIFIIYLVVGFLYIYFSDKLVHLFFPETEETLQTIKGWGFIVASGLLIYFLVNREIRKKNSINRDLNTINEVILQVSAAVNLEEIMRITNTTARRLVNADGVCFVVKDGDQCHYLAEDAITPLWKGKKFPLNTCISGWVMQHNEPVFIKDISNDNRIPQDVYRETFIKSAAVYPINKKEPVGAIAIYWANPPTLKSHNNEVLDSLTNTVAIAMEKLAVMDDIKQKNEEYYSLYEEYLSLNEELSDANAYLKQSEEKFRSFVENANDIIFSVDASGTFNYVSPNWKYMLGHESQDIVGKKIEDFVHPEDVQQCLAFLKKIIETNDKQSGVEYRVKHKDGAWRWHLANGSSVTNSDGSTNYIGIGRDITERKEMIKSLEDRNVFIQTVLDNLPIGVALNVFDKGKATYINERFEEIYGWGKEELHDITEFFENVYPDPVYRQKIINQVNEDIKSGDKDRMHWNNIKITRKDGTHRIINAVNIPLIEQNTMVSTVMDITELKEAEEQIKKIQSRLLRAEKIANFGNWEFNFNTRRVIASAGAKNIYGLFKEEITFEDAKRVPLAEYRPLLDQALTDVIKHDKPYDIRFKIKRLTDNQIRDIHSIAQYNKEKNVIFGVIHDITDVTKAEERFKQYIENSPTSVMICDEKGKYIFVNPAACQLLGYSREELLNMHLHDITVDAQDGKDPKSFNQLKTTGHTKTTNKRYQHKNGEIIDIALDAVKLSDNEYIAFTRDITELKNVQRELNFKNLALEDNLQKTKEINEALETARKIAEQNDRLKTAFLNNMSHEIRTPMNGILGFSELLTSESLSPEKKKKYSKVIRSSGEQLLHIIDDILDVSRLEAGEVILVDESFHLNTVFDLVASLTENQVNEKHKEIQLRVYKDLKDGNDLIVGDKARWIQILTNLATNAVKYTDVGYIEIAYYLKDQEIEISVKDTGMGISSDMHEAIFDRFRQTDDTISSASGGTGLGLSIVKGLVELMNGEIHLDSAPEVGSTFRISLPYIPGTSEKNTVDINNKTDKLHHKTILIAEDVQYSFDLLKEYLQPYQVNLIHALTGKAALSKIKNNSEPDMILMDMRMPEMDGYEAIRQIRKEKPLIPIIAQTAFAMREEKIKAYEAGSNDYITKPIDKDDLLNLLLKYL